MPRPLRMGLLGVAACALGCSAADADGTGARGNPTPVGAAGSSSPTSGVVGAAGTTDFGNAPTNMPPPPPMMVPVAPPEMGECGAVSQTAENTLQPADIIIGIDTSGSMDDEITFVQQHLNAFSQQIIDSGVDVRVILIATEGLTVMQMGGLFGGGGDQENAICIGPPLGTSLCPGDSNPPLYTHVNQEIGSNDILNIFISAYPVYSAQLRPNSLKTFVAITDDDATDGPINTADAFISAVRTLDPNPEMWSNWRYSSIYCATQCEFAAAIGAVHADLVAKTGGVGGDLCLQDFKPVFDELASHVVESVMLACDFVIPPPPGGEIFDQHKTNVQLTLDGVAEPLGKAPDPASCADRNGWHYDDENAPTKVVVCPATCGRIQAALNANVAILFGCETEVIVVR